MTKDKHRNFLFLQGPNSFFFKKLAQSLRENGDRTTKISFCGGDEFFWNDKNRIAFKGKAEEFDNFLKDLNKEYNFTDIVIYGDCRKYHKIAINRFKKAGTKIHVFEEGYFRPNWITYELDGVNDNSSYTYIHYIFRYFYEDIYSSYNPHRSLTGETEGRAWFRRWIFTYPRRLKHRLEQKSIIKNEGEYFLFALQLCIDSQIIEHSKFSGMRDAIDFVLRDFRKNAPKNLTLVVKSHPEEPGINKLRNKTMELTKELGLDGRILFTNGGNMPEYIKNSNGVICINSTTTLSALHHNKPVKCLGEALYNFEGLTDQKDLKDFWKKPTNADTEIFNKFKKYVHDTTQINGNFYNKEGINLLVKNLKGRI